MNSRIKSGLENLLLLGVSILVAGLIGEAFLRLFPRFLPEEARLRLHWRELGAGEKRSIPHPYVGFLYPPSVRGEIESGDVDFTYASDEHGFRNPSPWPPRAEIVCVGNSMVFGFGVSDDEVWTRLVDAGLPESRVLNLGLAGAAPQQYVRIFETFGVALEPRLLVFGLFPGNDVADAAIFNSWLKAGSPGNYDVWRFFRGPVQDQRMGFRRLLRKSHLLTTIRVVTRDFQSPFSSRTLDFPDGSRIQLAPAAVARNLSGAKPSQPQFQLTMRAIEDGRERARENGAEFLVLLFPTKEEVYLPVLGEPAPRGVAPFVEALERRGIPYLDLTPHFQERAGRDEKLFFEVDGHPNAAGNRLIAAVVLEHLRKNAAGYRLEDWN